MRPTVALPLLAVLLLSACGSGDGAGGVDAEPAGPTESSPSTASPSPAAAATTPAASGGPEGLPPSEAAPGPDALVPDPTLPPSGRTVTASGLVTDGVEAGCLLMESGGTVYLLLGAPADAAGQQAEVTGTLAPDTLSTCQQGVALNVSSFRAG